MINATSNFMTCGYGQLYHIKKPFYPGWSFRPRNFDVCFELFISKETSNNAASSPYQVQLYHGAKMI